MYVLIVGFGKDKNGEGYFIVKNHMGTDWGENGFFRISDSKENACGILANKFMFQITKNNCQQ